ncbi:MAG: sigma-70 family RNA polymerase sigma factor [Pseudomonadota bacterium]
MSVDIAAAMKPTGTASVSGKDGARGHADAEEWRMVEACLSGDQRAMEALYHRFKRRVFSLIVRIVGVVDAEEVVQEAFVRIFRGLPRFRGDSALGTWIYRLSVNAALSHVDRRPKQAEGEEALAQLTSTSAPPRDPKLAARLEEALTRLPSGYRAVIVLHDIEGMSHEEISAILGCRIGTSKSQLFKARARMRELLKLDDPGLADGSDVVESGP